MIYLDHAASTPCDPRVIEAMLPCFDVNYANPSSGHGNGRAAREATEQARQHVAALINASPQEIVWTAGASESDNLAVKGAARARSPRSTGVRGHVITSAIEHRAVLAPCRRLEHEGFELSVVAPTPAGIVTAETVESALRDDTVLVSVIGVSNELGTISEIARIGALCRSRGVLFHSDATQMVGHVPVDVVASQVDLLSLSGHKLGGPKGVGALYVRAGTELEPMIEGGSHEMGRRAGTLNVPGIVGLGRACELCGATMDAEATRLRDLRERLEDRLVGGLEGVIVNGAEGERAPHITNVCFAGLPGVPVIDHLDRIACASGSAMNSGVRSPSHVLTAIGVPDDIAVTAIRLSLGRSTTERDVDVAVAHVLDRVGSIGVPSRAL